METWHRVRAATLSGKELTEEQRDETGKKGAMGEKGGCAGGLTCHLRVLGREGPQLAGPEQNRVENST